VVHTHVLLNAALSPAGAQVAQSAVAQTGAPAALLAWLLIQGRLVLSNTTFSELQTRIFKPKFDRYLSLETRKQILQDVNATALWVEVSTDLATQRYSRDPDDDNSIHAAIAADACAIVSGDADLLVLDPIGALRILTLGVALDVV